MFSAFVEGRLSQRTTALIRISRISVLVGGLEHQFYFPIYWEESSQLTNIFQRGSNHQPIMFAIDCMRIAPAHQQLKKHIERERERVLTTMMQYRSVSLNKTGINGVLVYCWKQIGSQKWRNIILVGGLEHQSYFPIYWVAVIIPIDELHHFSGWGGWPWPTNQWWFTECHSSQRCYPPILSRSSWKVSCCFFFFFLKLHIAIC